MVKVTKQTPSLLLHSGEGMLREVFLTDNNNQKTDFRTGLRFKNWRGEGEEGGGHAPKTRQILVHFAQKLSQIQPTLYPSTCNPSIMAMPMSVLQTVTMVTDQGRM